MAKKTTPPPSFDDLYETVEFPDTFTGNPCLLETFGNELQIVLNTDPKRVWTVMDHPSADAQIIVAGLHYINRINYVITKTPWNDKNESYPW